VIELPESHQVQRRPAASGRLKIGLVSPYDYPFPGGVTEHIACLAAGLEKRGHSVRILAPSSASEEHLNGHPVYRLGSIVRVPYHGSSARITLSLGLRRKVSEILEREQFDMIHLHEPLLPMLPLAVLAQAKAPTVATFHAYWKHCRLYAAGRPFLRPLFDRLDGRIAVSEAARSYVGRYFPADYAIIPNGVDTTVFRPDLEPLPVCQGAGPSILFVGRLEKRKGFIHLLRAFTEVHRARPEVRLLVAGGYGHREQRSYEALVRRLGLSNVFFLGPLSRPDLARCYASCDVFCAPSVEGESFGIVLLEAMACGRAVVCSDISGYRAVVREGVDGRRVPAGDEPALAASLLQLLQDDSLRTRLGAAGLRRASEFDWSVVTRRVEDYYLSVLDRARERHWATAVGHPGDAFELALIFDMDGVLLDSEPLHLQALNQVLAPLGFHATAAENEDFFGLTSEECWRVIMKRYCLPGERDNYLAQYDKAVLRVLQQPVKATPGAAELIARIRRRGWRVGLASASKESWVNATLSALGLQDAFDVVVSSDDVALGKPAPDLFLLAAQRLHVPPRTCIVIEDSPNGLLAAKRAGMLAVALRTTSTMHLPLDDADVVIESLVNWDPAEMLISARVKRPASATA
jgi:phosphatidylinositol alpha-mannosyltransferase